MRNYKRGFTLAELLIVIGIIAVLMAIAIPVFGKQLRAARLATDHANMRGAYSAVAAHVTGELPGITNPDPIPGEHYYYQKDGTFASAGVGNVNMKNAYVIQVQATAGENCSNTVDHEFAEHQKGEYIYVMWTKADGYTQVKYEGNPTP